MCSARQTGQGEGRGRDKCPDPSHARGLRHSGRRGTVGGPDESRALRAGSHAGLRLASHPGQPARRRAVGREGLPPARRHPGAGRGRQCLPTLGRGRRRRPPSGRHRRQSRLAAARDHLHGGARDRGRARPPLRRGPVHGGRTRPSCTPPRRVTSDELWSTRRTSFGSAADAYAAGRPSYPEDALDWVLPSPARRVLDLAAGTGRLTGQLLARGLEVVAVEPDDAMRAHVPSAATAIAGAAENIPVGDASVDAVVVGQAFHWFDVPTAMPEIRRVLRPGGGVALFWNLLDDRDPLVDRLCDLLTADERASTTQDLQSPPYDGVEGLTEPERHAFHDAPTYDAERLVAFVLSRSRTILMPAAERERLLAEVGELAPGGEFALALVCEAWRGRRT